MFWWTDSRESIFVVRMILNRSALPRDARSLRRMLGEKEVLLIERERIIAEKETQLAERDRVIAVRDAELYAKTLQIEHLKAQLAVLKRARFGRSSEKLDREIEQLEFLLGDLEEGIGGSNTRVARLRARRSREGDGGEHPARRAGEAGARDDASAGGSQAARAQAAARASAAR